MDGKPSKHRPVSCELSSSKLRELIGQDVLGVEVWEPFLSQPVHEPPIPAELIQAWLLEPRQHVLLLDTGMSIGEFIARFNQGEGESFETRDSFRMVLDNTRPIECLNETLEAPEWRLVAKSTTDGTKNIPKEEQLAHVKQAGRRPGRARDYVFAIGLTQMTTGHILFEEESTNCEESIEVCTCRNVFMIENSENSRGIPSDRVGLGSTPDVTAGINW